MGYVIRVHNAHMRKVIKVSGTEAAWFAYHAQLSRSRRDQTTVSLSTADGELLSDNVQP